MASTVLAPQPSARALSAQGGPYAASSQHLGPYPDSSSSTFNLSTSYSFTSISGTSPSSSSGYRHSPDGGSGSVGGPSFSGAAYEPSTHPSSSAATSSSSLSSLPRQLRPRILSETSHQLSSRTPSPLSSPQLRFDPTEPTEPSGYHGETQFGYDFLPAVQPQLFVAPSTHPFASGVQQVHAYPSSTPSSSSSAEYAYGPHASTSTSAQEYRVTQNGQGSEPRFNADGHSEEGYRQDSRVSPGGFDGYSGGSTLVDHTRAINHERTYAGEGWNASGDVRQGGHEDMPWDNSGGEDDDDDDRGDLSMERRGSTEGERGEVKSRRRTTRAQFQSLEAMFLRTSKPTQTDRKNLGEQLDMSPRAVQVWFQNRRAKAKKARQKAALQHGGHGPYPGQPAPSVAFADVRYPPPANSGTLYNQHQPYMQSGSRVGFHGPSDEGQRSSFSPDRTSPPMGLWENVPSSRHPSMHDPLSHGHHSHRPQSNYPTSLQPPQPTNGPAFRRNSASPVYAGDHPQGWAPAIQSNGGGPGAYAAPRSPLRRGSGLPCEPRMARRPSANGLDGGLGPDRTIKRRESNGSVVGSDPLGGGGRRGSLPGHQQPYPSPLHPSPSRQPPRSVSSTIGGPLSTSHSYRAGLGGHRPPGSTVTQYLASSSSARRSSMPAVIHQGAQVDMYSPALPEHGGPRQHLSPIHDQDGFGTSPPGFSSMAVEEVGQPMFNPSIPNGGFPVYEHQQSQPIFGGYPPESQPHPNVSRPRAASYHHLHQLQQPLYDELDPLAAPPSGPPPPPQSAPPLAQYSFPAPIKVSAAPILQPVPPNLHLRRASATQIQHPQQPLFTSTPLGGGGGPYEYPPAPVGTLPDQEFSFGTYQQQQGGGPREVEYLDSDGTERGGHVPIARHASIGESDGGWNGYAVGPGQVAEGSYLGPPEDQSIPNGFHPDARRPSASTELLQDFSSLQMISSQNGVLPPPPARPPVQPLYAIHEASPSGHGSGEILQVPLARQEEMGLDHQQRRRSYQPQQYGLQEDWSGGGSGGGGGGQMHASHGGGLSQGLDPTSSFGAQPTAQASSHHPTRSSSYSTNPSSANATPETGPHGQSQADARYASPNLVFDLDGPGYEAEDEVGAKLGRQAGGGFGFGYR